MKIKTKHGVIREQCKVAQKFNPQSNGQSCHPQTPEWTRRRECRKKLLDLRLSGGSGMTQKAINLGRNHVSIEGGWWQCDKNIQGPFDGRQRGSEEERAFLMR